MFDKLFTSLSHRITPIFGYYWQVLLARHLHERVLGTAGKQVSHLFFESVNKGVNHGLLLLEIVIVLVLPIRIVLEGQEHAITIISGDVF